MDYDWQRYIEKIIIRSRKKLRRSHCLLAPVVRLRREQNMLINYYLQISRLSRERQSDDSHSTGATIEKESSYIYRNYSVHW
jgi:hypothetical protein